MSTDSDNDEPKQEKESDDGSSNSDDEVDVKSFKSEASNKSGKKPEFDRRKSSFLNRPSLVGSLGPRRSTVSGVYKKEPTKNVFEDMNNTDLMNAVQELQKNVKHYELENMVFQHFLEKNDPTVLEELQPAAKQQERRSSYPKRSTMSSRRSTRQSAFLGSVLSVSIDTAFSEKEGPRINITQKTDLVMREMEDIEAVLKIVSEKCYKQRHKLKAELEEMSIRESELNETLEAFDAAFIQGTSEKFTQKNPADRFARFMEEDFRKNRLTIDKLRLRTSSLKVQYQKICSQLAQKKSLGENLQEVDFEQLQITNKHLIDKIEKRNLLLLELKRMNGRANLLLSRTKKNLLFKVESLNAIKETIKQREELIGKLDEECDKVSVELEETKAEHTKIKLRSENFEVPAILDYVKTKAEMAVLRKNLKVWARRKQIKDMDLNAAIREMKHTTGLAKPKPSWFM